MIERSGVNAAEISDGTMYVGLDNIETGGNFVNVGAVAAGQLSSGKFIFTKHHILYGKLRPYLAKIARPDFGGICSTDILPILPGPEIDRDYLTHFLRLPVVVQWAASRATGANLPRVSPKELATFEIPVPPLPEQRRIATLLDQSEVLRVKRRGAIAQLDELTRSIFLDMFSRSHSDNWAMTTVARVGHADQGSIRTGPFGSQLLHNEFVDSGVAVLGIDNVVTNEFRWVDRRYVTEVKYRELDRYTVRPGDVLITLMGTCGRCAVVPEDIPLAINTKHLCCITLDRERCLPVYLHAYFLRHPVARRYLKQTAKGAIMSGLNMGIIKAMPLLLPPLAFQQEFADLVEGVERLKISYRAHLAELYALFASLQYRAFRGEL